MCCWKIIKDRLKKLLKYLSFYIKNVLIAVFKFLGIIFLIAIGFYISTIFLNRCDIKTPNDFETQEIFINGISLNNWTTWITLVGGISAAFWSIHQFNKNQIFKQQEKASNIAQDFADNLIERMNFISEVLMDNEDVQNMVEKIDKSELTQFTTLEAMDIFNSTDFLKKFIDIIRSEDSQEKYKNILNKRYSLSEQKKFDSYFETLVDNTLNKLEAICINISSKAAGSQFIYESLHQMFLSTIELLYIRISYPNTNNVDKYYTNIISVYNMWNLQKQKDIDKLNRTNKKVSKLEQKANKEIKKLLNKHTKTV